MVVWASPNATLPPPSIIPLFLLLARFRLLPLGLRFLLLSTIARYLSTGSGRAPLKVFIPLNDNISFVTRLPVRNPLLGPKLF